MAGIGTMPTRRLPGAAGHKRQVLRGAAQLVEDRDGTRREAQPVHRRLHTVGDRSNSLTPSIFQTGDGLGDRRLRQVQHRSSLAKTAVLEHVTKTRSSLIFKCRGRRWIRLSADHVVPLRSLWGQHFGIYRPIAFWPGGHCSNQGRLHCATQKRAHDEDRVADARIGINHGRWLQTRPARVAVAVSGLMLALLVACRYRLRCRPRSGRPGNSWPTAATRTPTTCCSPSRPRKSDAAFNLLLGEAALRTQRAGQAMTCSSAAWPRAPDSVRGAPGPGPRLPGAGRLWRGRRSNSRP